MRTADRKNLDACAAIETIGSVISAGGRAVIPTAVPVDLPPPVRTSPPARAVSPAFSR